MTLSLQKWPHTNISPIESLLVVFAYEKWTQETVTVDEIRDGMLGPKLTQQDFDMALQVKLITSTPSTPLFEKIVCKLFCTRLARNQCINPPNRTTRKTCLLCWNVQWLLHWCPFQPFPPLDNHPAISHLLKVIGVHSVDCHCYARLICISTSR